MSAAVSTLSDIIKRNDAVNVNPPNQLLIYILLSMVVIGFGLFFQFCIICNCARIHLQFY